MDAAYDDQTVSLRHSPQDAYLSLSQRLSSVGSFL
jgi:hypothetical protein